MLDGTELTNYNPLNNEYNSMYKINYYLYNKVCYTSCPAQTFQNGASCVICTAPCANCLSPTSCITCVSPYLLSGTTCVTNCPSGTYATTLTCAFCNSQCATCRGATSNDCLSCTTGYLLNNQCINACPSGTIPINFAC